MSYTKNDLLREMSKRTGFRKKDCALLYESLLDILVEQLNADTQPDVLIPQIGKIIVKKTQVRVSRNPKTGEEILVPSKRTAYIRISNYIKNRLVQTD